MVSSGSFCFLFSSQITALKEEMIRLVNLPGVKQEFFSADSQSFYHYNLEKHATQTIITFWATLEKCAPEGQAEYIKIAKDQLSALPQEDGVVSILRSVLMPAHVATESGTSGDVSSLESSSLPSSNTQPPSRSVLDEQLQQHIAKILELANEEQIDALKKQMREMLEKADEESVKSDSTEAITLVSNFYCIDTSKSDALKEEMEKFTTRVQEVAEECSSKSSEVGTFRSIKNAILPLLDDGDSSRSNSQLTPVSSFRDGYTVAK